MELLKHIYPLMKQKRKKNLQFQLTLKTLIVRFSYLNQISNISEMNYYSQLLSKMKSNEYIGMIFPHFILLNSSQFD